MSAILLCNAVSEPEAYLATADDSAQMSLAVTLAFEDRGSDNDLARAAHERFLRAALTAQFRLYRVIDAVGSTPAHLALIDVPCNAVGAPTGTLIDQVMIWLRDRSKGTWLSTVSPTDSSVSEAKMTASQYLASATSWAAPLPQDLGIVRTVRIPYLPQHDGERIEKLVLVLFFADAQIPPTLSLKENSSRAGAYEFDYDAGAGFAGAVGVAHQIDELDPDPTSLIDRASGFLRPDSHIEEVYRALKRIDEQGPSQLWTYPQMLSIDWRSSDSDPPPPDSLRCLVWRAMNGLSTLLDPIVLALTMAQTRQEGPFVSALLACIDEKFPEIEDEAMARFVTWLRDEIKLWLRRPAQEESPSAAGKADRSRLVERLKALLPIEPPSEGGGTVELTLLQWLLLQYQDYSPMQLPDTVDELPKWREKLATFESLEAALTHELGLLAQHLQSEQAVESIVKTLLAKVGLDATKLLAAFNVGELADYEFVLARFHEFIDQEFNGLEGVRVAQATLYRSLLIRATKDAAGAQPWQIGHLRSSLRNARWFERRLEESWSGNESLAFDTLREVLPVYAVGALSKAEFRFLVIREPQRPGSGQLWSAYETVSESFLRDRVPMRFVPDSAPLPLPVQLAVDVDTSEDEFATFFNGVGLLVRRSPNTDWAYANLATLTRAPNELTLLPLLPAVNDSQRYLFVEYDGLPLATQDFANTHAASDSQAEKKEAFYGHDAPTKHQLGGKLPLSALAYGCGFDVGAFLQTRSASLPAGVRLSAAQPWSPMDKPVPALDAALFTRFQYRRTTAIGRVLITESLQKLSAPRIGASIDDVLPLFRDFPRLGCCSIEDKKHSTLSTPGGVLELHRNADGTGAITLPEEGTISLKIPDLRWWSGGGQLRVDACCVEKQYSLELAGLTIDSAFATGALIIEISATKPTEGSAGRQLTFTPTLIRDGVSLTLQAVTANEPLLSTAAMWLRIQVDATDPVRGAALSCADTAAAMRSKHSASQPQTYPLVLLGANDGVDCRAVHREPVSATLLFSRVGFQDFDRWLNNPDVLGASEAQQKTLTAFRTALLAGYIARHLDIGPHPRGTLASLIDNLPDPAVEYLLIDLVPLADHRPLTERGTALAPAREVVPVASLLELIAGTTWDESKLVENLLGLATKHSASVELRCKSKSALRIEWLSSGTGKLSVKVDVPHGVVAQLSVRPMVREEWMGGMFHKRMKELSLDTLLVNFAAGKARDYCVFEGAGLVLESMLGDMAPRDELAELIAKAVKVLPAGQQRSYDLVATSPVSDEADLLRWSRLGSVEVHTQRWRFSGRPIYSWFDPRQGVKQQHDVAIEPRFSSELVQFEKEAFFDRDDQDVDTQRMRLLPDKTVLQSFPWEAPSATYFRHCITVRSRYAGALDAGVVTSVRAWKSTEDVDHDDSKVAARRWFRGVVLGDRTRLQLTRPQLRALIPLTAAPRVDGEETLPPTPPVLAILDERPFAHGGLADRIAAEIKASFGYRIVTKDGTVEPLQIEDQRKQIGPDAHHTYSAMPEADALAAVLHVEGPVGLTFDQDVVRAPAFANTALVLQPAVLTGDAARSLNLQEHRLSVGLRRYLDPRWLATDAGDGNGDAPTVAIDRSWWIEFAAHPTGVAVKYGEKELLCEIINKEQAWHVNVPMQRLDSGQTAAPNKPIEIGRVDSSRRVEFAMLYVPLEAGRASLSVFAMPRFASSEVIDGVGNLPLMLASVDVLVPMNATSLQLPNGAHSHRTSASPVTSMNWTRTGRHFELLHVGAVDDRPLQPMSAEQIAVRRNAFVARDSDEPLHLEPAHARQPMPLYVQRHQALLVTGVAGGHGRTAELHQSFSRYFGKMPSLAADAYAIRVVEFETPALPLATRVPEALGRFERAHFDLYSRLGNSKTLPKGFSLYLRPLGEARHSLRRLDLVVKLHRYDRGDVKPIEISVELGPSAAMLRGILIEMFSDQKPVVHSIRAGGDMRVVRLPDDIATMSEKLQDVRAIEISIADASGVAGEVWCDISLLTAPKGVSSSAPTRINFDWLFTGERSSNPFPADAVADAGLHSMVEAEARIVCVSPPLIIER